MMNFKLLKQLYQINSKSGKEEKIAEFIMDFIAKNYQNVIVEFDTVGNLYITKGKADKYPVIAAHLDQVGSYQGAITIFRRENIMIGIGEHGKQVNLGADDKNGIWIALELLRTEPVLKVVFFPGEEIGCVGSNACDMSFFDDAKFVIQCDRRNGKDFIYTAGCVPLCDFNFPSPQLKQKYGYINTTGLMTDVQTLKKRGLNVACCNLSCGYYNPHLETEYTDVGELINCLQFVREIVQTVDYTPHEYKAPTYPSCHYPGYNGYAGKNAKEPEIDWNSDWDNWNDDYYASWYAQYYKRY
jgi:putative aminopeptidase FrvX